MVASFKKKREGIGQVQEKARSQGTRVERKVETIYEGTRIARGTRCRPPLDTLNACLKENRPLRIDPGNEART